VNLRVVGESYIYMACSHFQDGGEEVDETQEKKSR